MECIRCGQKHGSALKTCKTCLEYVKKRRHTRGRCRRCGSHPVLTGRSVCRACLRYTRTVTRERIQRAKANGLCARCRTLPQEEGGYCLRCVAWRANYQKTVKSNCLRAYGGSCVCCGEIELEFLTIEHRNQDGAEMRRRWKIGAGQATYLWLKSHGYPQNLGLEALCWNCQQGRYHNGGICPHVR